MSAIKARKQGNSIMVTIPSALGVKEGEEFYVIKKDNGAITLIPKVEDYFADALFKTSASKINKSLPNLQTHLIKEITHFP